MPRENRLAGKVAIITGAASGIGAATVDLFTEQGARVLASDLPGSPLEARHGANSAVACLAKDVTDEDAPEALVGAALERFGRLDILFNNAGICPTEPYLEQSAQTWERTLAVNVTAVNRLTMAAAPHLARTGNGRVINTGSVQSQVAGPSLTAYTVSKHAVAGLTKQQALELGPLGITANYIQPGFVVTGITEGFLRTAPRDVADAFVGYWTKKAPVGRLGQPIDIARGALFLALDASNFINGIGLRIDGGALARL
jgi:NAD(P)-dependent dehydrogenase (short-subunit alcohol dehydrogenase family)